MQYKIEKLIKQWRKETDIKPNVLYSINWETREVTIFTHRPGLMIGREGCLVNKYSKKLSEYMKSEWKFLFKECRGWA